MKAKVWSLTTKGKRIADKIAKLAPLVKKEIDKDYFLSRLDSMSGSSFTIKRKK